jgi:hypothetical protein
MTERTRIAPSTAKLPSKRLMSASRMYAVVSASMLAVVAWMFTRLLAGDRNVGSAITIVLALAGVNALLTVYFYACAKRAEAIERARPGPVPEGVVET